MTDGLKSNQVSIRSSDVIGNEIFPEVKILSLSDRFFSKSFYKKRTAMYLDGSTNYQNKSASFGSYLLVIVMFVIGLLLFLSFGNLDNINVYYEPLINDSQFK